MAHMHTLHTLSIGNAIAAQGGNAFSGYIEQININSNDEAKPIREWLANITSTYNIEQVQAGKLRKLQEKRATGTGDWVVQELLPAWLGSTPSPQSLWLHGEVGCGKSTICSTIIDKVPQYLAQRERAMKNSNVLAFVIFAFDDDVSYGYDAVIRCLLLHLCYGVAVPVEVQDMKKNNQFAGTAELEKALFDVLDRYGKEWKQRKRTAEGGAPSCAATMPHSFTVVVDAINEIASVDLRNRVQSLIQRLHKCGQDNRYFPIRVCLCSPRESTFESNCRPSAGWLQYHLSAAEVNRDIRTYLWDCIEKHAKLSTLTSSKKQTLCDTIAKTAQGMFRLAALYWQELSSWDTTNFLDNDLTELLAAENLPTELFPFYDRLIDRIRPQSRKEDMFVIFKWILVAVHPMTIDELLEACAVAPTQASVFDMDKYLRCEDFTECLAGLITMSNVVFFRTYALGASYVGRGPETARLQTVTLAHFSVKQWLLQRGTTMLGQADRKYMLEARFDLRCVQFYAAQCCLTYIAHCVSQPSNTRIPFAWRDYAWNNWAIHGAAWREASKHRHSEHDDLSTTTTPVYVESRASPFSLRLFNTACCPGLYVPSHDGILHGAWMKLSQRIRSVQESIDRSFPKIPLLSGLRWLIESTVWLCLRSLGDETRHVHETIFKQLTNTAAIAAFEGRVASALQDPGFPDGVTLRLPTTTRLGRSNQGGDSQQATLNDVITIKSVKNGLVPIEKLQHLTLAPLADCERTLRLVALHSSVDSTGGDPIVCSQWVDTLDNKPFYMALSYNWTYQDECETIVANGRKCEIGSSLAAALRELRCMDRPVYMWVDAICMDMQNLAERGSQVRMMDRIYRDAESVILWLGSADGNADRAMAYLQDCGYPLSNVWKEEDIWHTAACQQIEALPVLRIYSEPDEELSSTDHTLWALNQLFSHRIWRKVWILLEFILASKVTIAWGTQRLDWSSVESWLSRNPAPLHASTPEITMPEISSDQMLPSKVQIYNHLRSNWHASVYYSLPEMLYHTRHFTCSEPIDKLLTMLHLIHPTERSEVLDWVDYSMSAVELSISAAKHCIRKFGNLDILSINNLRVCGNFNESNGKWDLTSNGDGLDLLETELREDLVIENRLQGLPSWAPAWHYSHWSRPLSPGAFDPSRPRIFRAGGSSRETPNVFTSNATTLSVPGFELDGIELLTNPDTLLTAECQNHSFFNILALNENELNQTAIKACKARYTTEPLTHVLWHTALADQWPTGARLPDTLFPYVDNQFDLVKNAINSYDRQGKLCVTRSGYLGLVPSWSRRGDAIVVIKGAMVPYVLRANINKGEWRLVGECYVHGIMDGEIVKDRRQAVRFSIA